MCNLLGEEVHISIAEARFTKAQLTASYYSTVMSDILEYEVQSALLKSQKFSAYESGPWLLSRVISLKI